jgi:nitroimidazol reductase NimA-like FMN-containing flavoprotein (pyridoxamine 5'-phosphate oxidase superfamily)
MRHPERELKNRETIIAMLKHSPVGRIATVNHKGFPVIKPVNFIYLRQKIYIHSSTKGEKVEDIQRGSPVGFEVDDPIAYVTTSKAACQANSYYRSLIVKGRASFVKDQDKKMEILEKMMEKYQPEGGYGKFEEKVLRKTAVIEISVEEMTGKENLG